MEESGTIAAKAIGVSGHYLLSLVDTGKFIIERYLASTNKSTFPQGKIEVTPRYKQQSWQFILIIVIGKWLMRVFHLLILRMLQ